MCTLILHPSFQLKKSFSLTRLKNNFLETAFPYFFERKIWQRQMYFFRRQPRLKFLSVSELTGMQSLLLQPSFHLKKSFSLTRLKNTFNETAFRHYFERKIWQRQVYFFRRQLRSKTFSISEPTRMHTLLLQHSFDLNKFLTRLKNTFRETAYWHHLRAKFDNDMSTFS